MGLCATNVRQEEMSHKQPHGYHFAFHWAVCEDETKYKCEMLLLWNGTDAGVCSFSVKREEKRLHPIYTVNRV